VKATKTSKGIGTPVRHTIPLWILIFLVFTGAYYRQVWELQCQVNTLKSEEYEEVASQQAELTRKLDQVWGYLVSVGYLDYPVSEGYYSY